MFAGVLALAAAAGFGLAAAVWSYTSSRRKRRNVFDAREPLASEEIFARYYVDSGIGKDVVMRLWTDCARALKVPAEKLRPTDRFEDELSASDFWASLDDPKDDLAEYAMALAKRRGTTLDLKATKTFDDLIRALARIEGEAPRRP